MSKANSESARRKWASMDPEQRSAELSRRMKLRWERTSEIDKRNHAMVLVNARLKKRGLPLKKIEEGIYFG